MHRPWRATACLLDPSDLLSHLFYITQDYLPRDAPLPPQDEPSYINW